MVELGALDVCGEVGECFDWFWIGSVSVVVVVDIHKSTVVASYCVRAME